MTSYQTVAVQPAEVREGGTLQALAPWSGSWRKNRGWPGKVLRLQQVLRPSGNITDRHAGRQAERMVSAVLRMCWNHQTASQMKFRMRSTMKAIK